MQSRDHRQVRAKSHKDRLKEEQDERERGETVEAPVQSSHEPGDEHHERQDLEGEAEHGVNLEAAGAFEHAKAGQEQLDEDTTNEQPRRDPMNPPRSLDHFPLLSPRRPELVEYLVNKDA